MPSGRTEGSLTPCPPSVTTAWEGGTRSRHRGLCQTLHRHKRRGRHHDLSAESPLPTPSLRKGDRGLGSFGYRVTQGIRALIPAVSSLDIPARDAALGLLPEQARVGFRALPRGDQSHALRVYHTLVGRGESDPDLLAAALLHDIGKHPGVGVTQKTARVLLARSPRLLMRLSADRRPCRRWRGEMARLLDHAALGAAMAAAWGCTPATVAIIRASHDADAPEIVRRLQAVDDAS